jgi:hypothetical protein
LLPVVLAVVVALVEMVELGGEVLVVIAHQPQLL